MKQIIDRRIFDTETAQEIHSESNGLSSTDFRSQTETLYQTKSGSFFLHGEGGGLTKYAASVGNSTCEGEEILPMSKDEAYDWLESVDAVGVIEEYFSDYVTEA